MRKDKREYMSKWDRVILGIADQIHYVFGLFWLINFVSTVYYLVTLFSR